MSITASRKRATAGTPTAQVCGKSLWSTEDGWGTKGGWPGAAIGLFDGLNWVPANNADDWLHLALGVAMVGTGYLYGKEPMDRTAAV